MNKVALKKSVYLLLSRLYFSIYVNNSSMEVFQMISFIKNYSLKNIKNKLLMLYILNVTDMIFTLLLLDTSYFIEANILMSKVVQSSPISFLLKVVLPAVLFICLYLRMKNASVPQLKISNFIINITTSLYILINISHIIWFGILPIFIRMS